VLFISLTTGVGIHRLVPQLVLLAVVPMLPFLFIWIFPSILNRIFAKHLPHTKVVLADDPSADIAYVKSDAAAESGAEAHIVLSFSVLKKMLLTSRRTKRPFAEVLTEEVQAIKEERGPKEHSSPMKPGRPREHGFLKKQSLPKRCEWPKKRA